MARSRLCRHCREFHDLAQPWPQACIAHFGDVGESAGYHVISDSMDPIRSMANGAMFDSKSAYRRDLKSRGLVEVGNERVEQRRVEAPPVRDTLRRVVEQMRG